MIYTRSGDRGNTSLADGTRVAKSDVRIEALGALDEFNAHLALVAEQIRETDAGVYATLKEVQQHVFAMQTAVALPSGQSTERWHDVFDVATAALEHAIDLMQAELPKLETFVVPGGTMESATLHVARTVCRRAERRVVALERDDEVMSGMLAYINRLSDYLFVAARWMNFKAGVVDSCVIVG